MAKTGPKPFLNLADFVPADAEQMLALEDALLKVGVGASRAARISARLFRLGITGDDGLSGADRNSYRHELARLGEPPWRRRSAAKVARDIWSDSSVRRGRRPVTSPPAAALFELEAAA